jgi:hypothetical protein
MDNKIKIFTFNVNQFNNPDINLDINKFHNDLIDIFQPNISTIYFISTQEDIKESFFINQIKTVFNRGNLNNRFFFNGSYNKSIDPNYNVHGLLIISKELYKLYNFNFLEYNKTISHNYISSKGSVIIELENELEHFFFIGSHLPMDNNKEDLGLEGRIEAMNQVTTYLKKKIDHKKSFNIIWTGDLNFRINNEREDQLENLLFVGIDPKLHFQDLSKIKDYNPTCKTVMFDYKDNCDPKVDPYIDPNNNTCYEIESTKIKKNIFGVKKIKKKIRIPSYCDRVIGYTNKGKYNDSEFYTETFYPHDGKYEFTKFSDHNPILTTLKISLNKINTDTFDMSYNPAFYKGGGIDYSIKYIKYYQKYKNY